MFPSKLRATLADGSQRQVEGTVRIRCSYKGFTLVCIAVIMNTGNDQDSDILIGNQFLRPANMVFNWDSMTVSPRKQGVHFEKRNAYVTGKQVSTVTSSGCRFTQSHGEKTKHQPHLITGQSPPTKQTDHCGG